MSESDSQPEPAADAYLDSIRTHAWRHEIPDEAVPWRDTAEMILGNERKMLRWLATHWFSGLGSVVDAGCFAGRSTVCLATGLRDNARAKDCAKPIIHAYDLFRVPRDAFSRDILGSEFPVGSSFRPVFERATEAYSDLIAIHEGDLKAKRWNGSPIEILFVDVAKCWLTNQHIISEFFPHLISGQSIIIQQDYNTPYVPWVHVAMEFLAEYMAFLCDEDGSKLFLLTKPIPAELLKRNLRTEIKTDHKIALLDRAIAKWDPQSAACVAASKAMLVFMEQGMQEGLACLEPLQDGFAGVPAAAGYFRDVRSMIEFWKVGADLENDMTEKFERETG